MRSAVAAGIGGIVFAVLWFVAAFTSSAPGGSYSASDVADYVAKDHRASVFIAVPLGLLSVLGLLLLLAGLRERVAGTAQFTTTVFWSASTLSVAGFAIGWMTVLTVPISKAIGGSSIVVIDPLLTFTITEIGWMIMFGVGGTFLGVALITSMIGSHGTLPSWLRWFTLIVGVLGLASIAWFPFFALLLWALVASIWLIASGRADQVLAS